MQQTTPQTNQLYGIVANTFAYAVGYFLLIEDYTVNKTNEMIDETKNFISGHIIGITNLAADYLSILPKPKGKLKLFECASAGGTSAS